MLETDHHPLLSVRQLSTRCGLNPTAYPSTKTLTLVRYGEPIGTSHAYNGELYHRRVDAVVAVHLDYADAALAEEIYREHKGENDECPFCLMDDAVELIDLGYGSDDVQDQMADRMEELRMILTSHRGGLCTSDNEGDFDVDL